MILNCFPLAAGAVMSLCVCMCVCMGLYVCVRDRLSHYKSTRDFGVSNASHVPPTCPPVSNNKILTFPQYICAPQSQHMSGRINKKFIPSQSQHVMEKVIAPCVA